LKSHIVIFWLLTILIILKCMGEEKRVYRILVGKPGGKRPLGRTRRRRVDGIIMDLRETGWGDCRVDPVGSG
jgi:hypothetical protein